jgi:hypothetical protein
MAGTPGKNKKQLGTRVLFDDSGDTQRDISGDIVPGSLNINGITLEQVNMTGISQAINNFLAGQGDLEVTAQAFMSDLADTGAWTVLEPQNGLEGLLTIRIGTNGAVPDTGDPELEFSATCFLGALTVVGGAWATNVSWRPHPDTAGTVAWGVVS